MKQRSVVSGIKGAVYLVLLSLPLSLVLSLVLPWHLEINGVVATLTTLYLWFALERSGKGQVLLLVAAMGVLGVGTLLFPPILFSTMAVFFVFVLRVVERYRSVAPIVIDGALCLVSFVGAWGVFLSTGSLTLAIWLFLLLQSLSVLITCKRKKFYSKRFDKWEGVKTGEEHFVRASRVAEEALAKMELGLGLN